MKEPKTALVYTTHSQREEDPGKILFYSFDTRQSFELGCRQANSGINPNKVKILYKAEDRLFDAGQYGLYDTLKNQCLVKGEIEYVALCDGFVYLSGNLYEKGKGVFRFPLDDPSGIEEAKFPKDARIKGIYVKAKRAEISGNEYCINNNAQESEITGSDGVTIKEPLWIDEVVGFPEAILTNGLDLESRVN